MTDPKENPAGRRGFDGAWRSDFDSNRITFPTGHNPTEIVVCAVERATGKPRRRCGTSWRLCCPSCGGGGYKLSVAEGDDGRALVTCFACHDTPGVLARAGLALKDLYLPRAWPESPDERRRASRAMRIGGWAAALSVLSLESTIVLFAARELWCTGGLSVEDGQRLRQAVDRISDAQEVLCGR